MSGHYQICVSGASKGDSVEQGKQLASDIGAEIARAGHSLLTGATTGLPDVAAHSYKKAGGTMSLGISPASTKVEHILKYRLPVDCYDAVLYTGMHYVGRDALLIGSADAVVSIGGRLGTLHEFTIAMETKTPIGMLQGAGGVSSEIKELMAITKASDDLVIFDTDPAALIDKLTKLLDTLHAPYKDVYKN